MTHLAIQKSKGILVLLLLSLVAPAALASLRDGSNAFLEIGQVVQGDVQFGKEEELTGVELRYSFKPNRNAAIDLFSTYYENEARALGLALTFSTGSPRTGLELFLRFSTMRYMDEDYQPVCADLTNQDCVIINSFRGDTYETQSSSVGGGIRLHLTKYWGFTFSSSMSDLSTSPYVVSTNDDIDTTTQTRFSLHGRF